MATEQMQTHIVKLYQLIAETGKINAPTPEEIATGSVESLVHDFSEYQRVLEQYLSNAPKSGVPKDVLDTQVTAIFSQLELIENSFGDYELTIPDELLNLSFFVVNVLNKVELFLAGLHVRG